MFSYQIAQMSAWLTTLGITGVTAALAAWGIFKWLGRHWIEDHFSKELETFKAQKTAELEKLKRDYALETEKLKAELGRFADRAIKFHAREYAVLPEAWGLMNKAHGAVSAPISAFQTSADLSRMTNSQLDSWLERSELETYQKNEIRDSSPDRRNNVADKIRTVQQLNDANRAVSDFKNYIILNGVFIAEDMSERMMEAAMQMQKALISRSMVERIGDRVSSGQTDFWQRALDELEPVSGMVQNVKFMVRQHLSNISLTTE